MHISLSKRKNNHSLLHLKANFAFYLQVRFADKIKILNTCAHIVDNAAGTTITAFSH